MTVKKKLYYVSDEFLEKFRIEFNQKYLNYYKKLDYDSIKQIFDEPGVLIESDFEFDFTPLNLEGNTIDNIKIIWESLKNLSPAVAANEKLWVALENTYYLDYHLNDFRTSSGKLKDENYKARTIFTRSKKRSLMMNNLSILWWVAYYTYDKKQDNPYYYTEFFVRNQYRGDAIAFFSSNILSNKEMVFGILDALIELEQKNIIKINRYAFTNSNKILNQIGGVRIIDMLSREEIKKIIIDNLPNTEHIKLQNK